MLALGTDIVQIPRIEKLLTRFGVRFETRIFTAIERERATQYTTLKSKAAHYAKRFAAKEACVKALGTGVRDGIRFHEIGVVNSPAGQPTLVLTGNALTTLNALSAIHQVPLSLHLSMSDDYPTAIAVVMLVTAKQAR